MKKQMLMLACAAGALVAAAEKTLIGAAELAPFGEITQAGTTFGQMVGNPLMATMMLGGAQQGLAKTYGRLRSDAPVFWLFYADAEALANAKAAGKAKDPVTAVLVYPRAEGPAQLLLKHTGSTKEADGTIHLLPGRGRPNDTWVKYTAGDAFCAFAASPALALRAAKDGEKLIANRKARVAKGHTPLALVRLNERGLATLVQLAELAESAKKKAAPGVGGAFLKAFQDFQSQQSARQIAQLRGYRAAALALDLNDTGIVLTAKAQAKPGAPQNAVAGFQLPAGAFDVGGVASPFFGAGAAGLQSGPATAAEQRAFAEVLARLVGEGAQELKKQKEAQQYAKLIDELAPATQEFLRTVPFPEPTDWSAGALAFDAAHHPCLVFHSEEKAAPAALAAGTKFFNRLVAACTRQWPGQTFFAKTGATGWTLDAAALADVLVKESGRPQTAKDRKELAEFKANFAKAMGNTKILFKFSSDGRRGFIGAPNVTPVKAAGAKTGEARLAAALPETVKTRPAGAVCLTPYAFVRETLLPIVARFADKSDLAQIRAVETALPAPTKNGALAAAAWVGKDGSARAVLRITADEIRNLGAAFNAYTAAQMSAAGDDDE